MTTAPDPIDLSFPHPAAWLDSTVVYPLSSGSVVVAHEAGCVSFLLFGLSAAAVASSAASGVLSWDAVCALVPGAPGSPLLAVGGSEEAPEDNLALLAALVARSAPPAVVASLRSFLG